VVERRARVSPGRSARGEAGASPLEGYGEGPDRGAQGNSRVALAPRAHVDMADIF